MIEFKPVSGGQIYYAKIRNAEYKTYTVYGGSFTNLIRLICHSFSADSWVIGPWGCPSYHCHPTKLIEQFTPTVLSILTSRHYKITSYTHTVLHCSNLSEMFDRPCMVSKELGYHRWHLVSLYHSYRPFSINLCPFLYRNLTMCNL